MNAKVLGLQTINFTNNNGETITGTKIFCAFNDPAVEGHRTEGFFIKSDIKLPEFKVNDTIDICFNRKGKPEKVIKV